MLILSRQPYRRPGWNPGAAPAPIFVAECSLDAGSHVWHPAEIYLDTGADASVINVRWLKNALESESCFVEDFISLTWSHGKAHLRTMKPIRCLIEGCEVELPIGCIIAGYGEEEITAIPSDEDILFGQDIFRDYNMLLIFDTAQQSFSLLAPAEDDPPEEGDRLAAIRQLLLP